MKHLKLLSILLAASFLLHAQKTPYNVVFDLTSKDTANHSSMMRMANAIIKEHPDAQLEIVLYGQSLGMVQKDKSTVVKELEAITQNKNVQVNVCAVAMKRHQVDKAALLPNIGIVPDGIYEIIVKQQQGWGYIKVAQ